MHELGVVFTVIRNVKEVAIENQAEKVKSVTLEIGEVSGIVHEYLISAWDWAKKKEELVKESELLIETIPAISHCEDCGKDYETVTYAKICPDCGSGATYLIQGNEFLIKEIEIE